MDDDDGDGDDGDQTNLSHVEYNRRSVLTTVQCLLLALSIDSFLNASVVLSVNLSIYVSSRFVEWLALLLLHSWTQSGWLVSSNLRSRRTYADAARLLCFSPRRVVRSLLLMYVIEQGVCNHKASSETRKTRYSCRRRRTRPIDPNHKHSFVRRTVLPIPTAFAKWESISFSYCAFHTFALLHGFSAIETTYGDGSKATTVLATTAHNKPRGNRRVSCSAGPMVFQATYRDRQSINHSLNPCLVFSRVRRMFGRFDQSSGTPPTALFAHIPTKLAYE